MEDTGLKLFEFVNNSFSNTIKSALEKQSKDKRKVNCRKYIEKNRQKTCRKLKNVKPKAAGAKSQSRKLQQNRLQDKSYSENQCLPPWPAFDNGYTIVPSGMQDSSFILPTSLGSQLGPNGCDVMTQTTLDFDQVLQQFLAPPVTAPMPTVPVTAAPFETTVDYSVECYSDHSRPLSPYDSADLTSNISEKDLEDLMIDQLQGSPGSGYSTSPMASCVPSPHRTCESQLLPPMGYPVYEDMSLFH